MYYFFYLKESSLNNFLSIFVKLSAQDSRRRKKDYLESIESRAMRHAEENVELHKKLNLLTKQNQTLVS